MLRRIFVTRVLNLGEFSLDLINQERGKHHPSWEINCELVLGESLPYLFCAKEFI
jgi:hypothetical protein